jgi:hypothetical protein
MAAFRQSAGEFYDGSFRAADAGIVRVAMVPRLKGVRSVEVDVHLRFAPRKEVCNCDGNRIDEIACVLTALMARCSTRMTVH